jgi:hypothetical protein
VGGEPQGDRRHQLLLRPGGRLRHRRDEERHVVIEYESRGRGPDGGTQEVEQEEAGQEQGGGEEPGGGPPHGGHCAGDEAPDHLTT